MNVNLLKITTKNSQISLKTFDIIILLVYSPFYIKIFIFFIFIVLSKLKILNITIIVKILLISIHISKYHMLINILHLYRKCTVNGFLEKFDK